MRKSSDIHKVVRIHNIEIRLKTNSRFIANLVSDQFSACKFMTGYKKRASLSLNLSERKNNFLYGRSDNFHTNKNKLLLECWMKNILVNTYPDKNLIVGKIVIPTTLSNEAIFDLLVIHPIRHILKYRNIFMVHSATLSKNNRGVLICGAFRSGKSTLAVKLVEDGFKFLSDEFVIFDKGRLLSFPLKLGLEIKSIEIFPRLRKLAKKTEKGYEKISFDVRDFYPGSCIESCAPEIIIFPAPQEKSKKVIIKPIDKKDAFGLLCMDKDNALPFEKNLAIRQKQIDVLGALAEKAKSYYLAYSLDKIAEASKAVDNLLKTGAS